MNTTTTLAAALTALAFITVSCGEKKTVPHDHDGDGKPDDCDPCPLDKPDDSDGDDVCDSVDLCPGFDDNVDCNGNNVIDGCERFGQMLEMDGTGDYISIPASASLDFTDNSFTFEFWFRRTAAGDFRFIEHGNYLLYWNDSTSSIGLTFISDSSLSASVVLLMDAWHHITGTFDVTTGDRILYLNGVEIARDTASQVWGIRYLLKSIVV